MPSGPRLPWLERRYLKPGWRPATTVVLAEPDGALWGGQQDRAGGEKSPAKGSPRNPDHKMGGGDVRWQAESMSFGTTATHSCPETQAGPWSPIFFREHRSIVSPHRRRLRSLAGASWDGQPR